MTPHRLLEQLLVWEQRVRQVYTLLSQQHQFPADLRAMWQALAADETHHIVALERSAHLLSVMDNPPSIPKHALAEVEAIIAAAEAAVRQPSLTSDEAFRHALSIEGSEFNPISLLIKSDTTFLAAIGKSVSDYTSLTWKNFLFVNLLPVTIGNILGGVVLVGLTYWFVYLRPETCSPGRGSRHESQRRSCIEESVR